MGDLERYRPGGSDIALKTDGNPAGKGLNGFLLDWARTEPRGLVVKPRRQILAEFFTSMLVLSARFKYQPAIGVHNYLYFINGGWELSLIAPTEWSAARRTGFAGTCVLQPDMTWTIAPSERVGDDNAVTDAIGRFYDAFADTLDSDLTLEDILPFHVRRMPYWQRLHASALSRSIRATLRLAGHDTGDCRSWRRLLSKPAACALTHEDAG